MDEEHGRSDALGLSEATFRAVYAHAPCAIGLFDDGAHFVDANPALQRLIGTTALRGRPISEFVPAPWQPRLAALLQPRSDRSRCEFPLQTAAGLPLPMAWRLARDIEPGLHLLVATAQRPGAADEPRGHGGEELIAAFSHELRTPLNAILQWVQVLKMRGGSPEQERAFAVIERNVTRQGQLLGELLEMAQLAQLTLCLEMLDPAALLMAALQDWEAAVADKAQRLQLALAPPYRPIRADGARLQQLIGKLLANAIKFSPRGGSITLGLSQHPDGLRLWVADEGQGISADLLPRVFDRFSRGAKAGLHSGLGLGLFAARQLAEAHGGTILASSDGPGRGACFTVWLPDEAPGGGTDG